MEDPISIKNPVSSLKEGLHDVFWQFYFVLGLQLFNKFIKVDKTIHYQKGNFIRKTMVMIKKITKIKNLIFAICLSKQARKKV